jgi:manganese-dependent inorganic pyrophosphatase
VGIYNIPIFLFAKINIYIIFLRMNRVVLGHKNPDLDSVVSTVVYSQIAYNISYPEARPFLTGKPNKETRFVFETFGESFPDILDSAEGREVVLVDHNESTQWLNGVTPENISVVIDHHKVNFSHSEPIFFRVEPVGSTSTILSELLFEHAQAVPINAAKLLISGILSDTLMFTSPTTRSIDRQMVDRLNKIARIPNIQNFADSMFKAKSDLDGLSMDEVLSDFKVYNINNNKIKITSLETASPDTAMSRLEEMKEFLTENKNFESYDYSFLFIVDIINQKSTIVSISEKEEQVVKPAYFAIDELGGGLFLAPGMVSRKKQMVPPLEEYFNNQ